MKTLIAIVLIIVVSVTPLFAYSALCNLAAASGWRHPGFVVGCVMEMMAMLDYGGGWDNIPGNDSTVYSYGPAQGGADQDDIAGDKGKSGPQK